MYALLFIFFVQILTAYYIHFIAVPDEQVGKWMNAEAAAWMHSREIEETSVAKNEKTKYPKAIAKADPQYFLFNPNTCSTNEFLLLGLSVKQAKMIEKYRSFGSGFKSKVDFAKVYCINEQEFKTLKPWIDLPDSFTFKQEKKDFTKFKKEKISVDLSTADSTELEKIPGIGPSFARRIINYRNKLSAYYSLEQLRDVWGMSDSLFQKIKPYLYVSDTMPGTLNMNTISIQDFGKHPYVGYALAKVIISYREQHGAFKSIDEMRKVPVLTDEFFQKLAPYLIL